MRILITGITGLFGSYLAREFSQFGEIHGLRRKGSSMRLLGNLAEKVVWHEGEVNNYTSLDEAFDRVDLIIHAAGLVSYDSKDKDKLLRVNVEGTANVVNLMLEKNINKLLYISSVAALGRLPETSWVDENVKWVDSPLNTPYATSKYLGELEVWRGAQEGLKVMVFNPSVLLGKISDERSSASIYKYVLGGNNYYPIGSINYIDIRDAAKLVRLLYQRGNWNERYILNNESLSYRLFFGKAADVFDKKAPSVPVAGWMLALALGGLKIKNLFSKNKSPLKPQLARLAQLSLTFDNQKATQKTDFEYTSLKSTLTWASGNSI